MLLSMYCFVILKADASNILLLFVLLSFVEVGSVKRDHRYPVFVKQ